MKQLSPNQLKMLKKIKRLGDLNCSHLSEQELAVIKFLRSEGLLDAKTKDGFFPFGSGQVSKIEIQLISVKISENGKAYLSELKADKIHWLVPIIISIFAAIGAYRQELALLLQAIEQLLK